MGITYKAPNLTLAGQFVYFMVDVPHLMKTTRNAWSSSQAKGTCHLEVIILEYSISLFHDMVSRIMVKKSNGHI